MTTTMTSLVNRAVSWSVANGGSSLTSDTAEIINRIAADERALFDMAALSNSYYYAVEAAVTSTAAASARTIATATLAIPCARILRFVLVSGAEVNQVDLRDTDAELSPRYFLLGQTMKEVSNDWSATSGAVSGTLTYVRRPTVLDTAGALSQTVTLDDRFVDLLEMRLAWYLAHKDVGRDAPELVRLEQQIQSRTKDFIETLGLYGGAEVRRFNLPVIGAKR